MNATNSTPNISKPPEVLFQPRTQMLIQNEEGERVREWSLPACFRPIEWPEDQWICTRDNLPRFYKNRNITLFDYYTQKEIPISTSNLDLASRGLGNDDLISLVYTTELNSPNFDDYIKKYRSVLQALHVGFNLPQKGHLAEWETLALQIAMVHQFLLKKSFVCFTLSEKPFQFTTVSISSKGKIFLDFPNKLGAGASRTFTKSLWLDRQQKVAKGTREFFSSSADSYTQNEISALQSLNGSSGIIQTYSLGIHYEAYGLSSFLVYQERYQESLWDFIHMKPLTNLEKIDLVKDLLFGLTKIAKKGIHFDIRPPNILVGRDASGKMKGVITDFGLFVPWGGKVHSVLSYKWAPPEYQISRIVTTGIDVWMMGVSLLFMFTGKPHLPSLNHNRNKAIERICNLRFGWCVSDLMQSQTPKPIIDLLNLMLHPEYKQRISPEGALDFYLKQFNTNEIE